MSTWGHHLPSLVFRALPFFQNLLGEIVLLCQGSLALPGEYGESTEAKDYHVTCTTFFI
jgi:hypothetical protein